MLERPLGDVPSREGAGSGPGAAQRPGFGAATTRKLRATEEHLTAALANRGREPLVNSMHNDDIIDRSLLAHRLGLDRVVQLPGMKRQMKAVLETYNAKYPGMEARMFSSMQHATRTATRTLEPGQTLRGLAMQNAYHAVAVEFRCHPDRRISAIVLDGMKPGRAEMESYAEVLGKGRHNRGGRMDAVLFCGLDVQKDHSSCAGFTKDFLKELHRHEGTFAGIHRAARGFPGTPQGRLPPGISHHFGDAPIFSLSHEASHHYLPLPLFKNVQSAERLAGIVNTRPGALLEGVNARGETIPERLGRLTGKEWITYNERRGEYLKKYVRDSDKVVPMAENYRRMHRKAADFGETGVVPRPADRDRNTFEF